MRFSILIPVYNVERYIRECFESISRQSYQDYEVVIVDDGSTDNSGVLCDDYCRLNNRARVIHKSNGGLISARRTAIENAVGEYIVFCDSDDYLEPKALQELNNIIENNHPDLIIYNAFKVNNENKTPLFRNVFKEGWIKNKQEVYDSLLLDYSINSLCLKAVNKNIIDKDENYNALLDCNYGEDLLQSVPIINRAEEIYYLNKELYNYRIISGMMRKFNDNYYWSYKKVNRNIYSQLLGKKIVDLDYKIAFHLIIAAYGAATQLKYCPEPKFDNLKLIQQDKVFRKSYYTLKKSCYWHKLSFKERLIIIWLKKGWFKLIYFILRIKVLFRGEMSE